MLTEEKCLDLDQFIEMRIIRHYRLIFLTGFPREVRTIAQPALPVPSGHRSRENPDYNLPKCGRIRENDMPISALG